MNIKKGMNNLYYSIFKYKRWKILFCNQIGVGVKYLFECKVALPHPIGIVIAKNVKIGNNCRIYQNVTIGRKGFRRKLEVPSIGDNVIIYAGSVIVGDINIGDNAIIAANSLVMSDVGKGEVFAGNPAKRIKHKP